MVLVCYFFVSASVFPLYHVKQQQQKSNNLVKVEIEPQWFQFVGKLI